MPTVSPTQWTTQELITAASLNQPINQLAAVINGGLDDANLSSFSGSHISAGTLPATASTVDSNVITRMNETMSGFIVPGGLVLSVISGLNVALSAGTVYINGNRIVVNAVASTTLPASQDVYVSVSSTGAVSFASTVANNAASPAIPSNSLWIGVISTNGAGVSLINQGYTPVNNATLPPTVSGNTLWKFDTNGVAIYPCNPIQSLKVLQYRTTTASTGSTGSNVAYNGFSGSYKFNIIAGRTYRFSIHEANVSLAAGVPADIFIEFIINGALVGSATKFYGNTGVQDQVEGNFTWTATTTGSVTLTLNFHSAGSTGTWTLGANNTDQVAVLEVMERS